MNNREKNIQECITNHGWTREEIERGYIVTENGITGEYEVQTLDDLELYGLQKFENDEQAQLQANEDYFKILY